MLAEAIDRKEIGKRLKALRLKSGLDQKELAEKIEVSNTTISMYESGERIPRDEIKMKLAKHFKTDIRELFY